MKFITAFVFFQMLGFYLLYAGGGSWGTDACGFVITAASVIGCILGGAWQWAFKL